MKKIIGIIYLTFSLGVLCSAIEYKNYDIPDEIVIGDINLVLNGAGARTAFFVDVYIGALYLIEKCSDANEIVDADDPMAIALHITSSLISSDKMKDAVIEGFENSTGDDTSPIRKKIDSLLTVFTETIKKEDVYKFVYVPNEGLSIYKNNEMSKIISGFEFKKAFFGIWLCDNPPTKKIKSGMLGR